MKGSGARTERESDNQADNEDFSDSRKVQSTHVNSRKRLALLILIREKIILTIQTLVLIQTVMNFKYWCGFI